MVILRLKHHFLLFLLCIIFGIFANVISANSETCLILAWGSNQLHVMDYGDTESFSAITIGAVDYSVSPDQRYLLVEQYADTPSGKQILLYEITQTELIEIAEFADRGLIRGGTWSPDSSRFVLQDGFNNYWITLYTIQNGEVSEVAPDLPNLEVFQVTWSPDGERFAFAAMEFAPSNDVIALRLYVATEDSMLWVSPADESVEWYFDSFLWLNDDELMYVSCENSEYCYLNIANHHTYKIVRWNGVYRILHRLSTGEMLLLHFPQGDDVQAVKFDTTTMEFEVVGRFSEDLSLPTIFSLSPDETQALIIPAIGGYSLFNMETGAVEELLLDGFEASAWNLDGNGLLVVKDNSIYEYLIHTGEVRTITTLQDDTRILSASFMCFTDR